MSSENTSKLKQNIFTLVIITIAGAMIYGLPYFRSYFYDAYLETYNLTNTQMGMFGSIFGIFGAISYLFGGVIADMVSTRKLMSVSLILTGIGGFLHMLNPSYGMLLCIYALWGFTSLFAFWPSLIKSLREISGPDEQSKATGFMDGGRGIVYAIDGACIVAIFGYFSNKIGDAAGLDSVIVYYSSIAILLGVIVYILLGKVEKRNGIVETKEVEKKEKGTGLSVEEIKKLLKMPQVWMVCLILTCTYNMNMAFYYFTPYSTAKYGTVATAAAFITIAAQYVRPVAAFGGGIIADKMGRSNWLYVTFSLMAVGTFLLLIVPNMSSPIFIIVCLVIYFGMYGGYSIAFSMLDEAGVPLALAGTAVGLVSTIGYLPEIIVPYLSGSLLDKFGDTGYTYLFTFVFVMMIIGIGVAFLFNRYMKKHPANEGAN